MYICRFDLEATKSQTCPLVSSEHSVSTNVQFVGYFKSQQYNLSVERKRDHTNSKRYRMKTIFYCNGMIFLKTESDGENLLGISCFPPILWSLSRQIEVKNCKRSSYQGSSFYDVIGEVVPWLPFWIPSWKTKTTSFIGKKCGEYSLKLTVSRLQKPCKRISFFFGWVELPNLVEKVIGMDNNLQNKVPWRKLDSKILE